MAIVPTRVWALGGFLGSEIDINSSVLGQLPWRKIWLSFSALAGGLFPRLGLGHQAPSAAVTRSGAMLGEGGYGVMVERLKSVARCPVVPRGYDWRLPIGSQAILLAAAIAEPSAGDSQVLVAHSMGGLVARRAWQILKLNGLEGRLRRIVTLGTPHQGSYGIVRLMLRGDETSHRVAEVHGFGFKLVAGVTTRGLIRPQRGFVFERALSTVLATAASWPAAWQLLPAPSTEDAAPLYLRGRWPDSLELGPDLLDRAFEWWDQVGAADRPELFPPPSVLTFVAGVGVRTPAALVGLTAFEGMHQLRYASQGDGQVMTSSSIPLDFYPSYRVLTTHSGLPADGRVLDALWGWLTEEHPDPVGKQLPGGLSPTILAGRPPRRPGGDAEGVVPEATHSACGRTLPRTAEVPGPPA